MSLSVDGLLEGCFVDNDGDNPPDPDAGTQQVVLNLFSKATVIFLVTIECHAPGQVGDVFQVTLTAQLSHLVERADGNEPAADLGDNVGSDTSGVKVIRE